jgi:hypothetical protein
VRPARIEIHRDEAPGKVLRNGQPVAGQDHERGGVRALPAGILDVCALLLVL